MNPNVDCTEAVAALLGVVEKGGSMSDETREHLRTCERCRELLDSARQFQTVLGEEAAAPEIHPDAAALEREVAKSRRRDMVARVLVSIVIIAMFAFFWVVVRTGGYPLGQSLAILFAGIFIAMLIAAPILLLVSAAKQVAQPRDGRRIYRRLGPGRQLSGVCLGLSEGLGISVGTLRLLFVIGFFVKGIGLLVYIIFVLAVPVHPDDRQYMLRFKLRRAFGGNR